MTRTPDPIITRADQLSSEDAPRSREAAWLHGIRAAAMAAENPKRQRRRPRVDPGVHRRGGRNGTRARFRPTVCTRKSRSAEQSGHR